jgi:hypothetical protein
MSTQFVRSVIVTVLSLTERLKARTVRVRVLTAVLSRWPVGCDTVSLGEWIPTFRRILTVSQSRTAVPKRFRSTAPLVSYTDPQRPPTVFKNT